MTSSTSSTFRSAPDDDGQGSLQLCDPGALFAAVPAMLGYHPHRSLIVLSLAGPDDLDVTTIMRHDLVLDTDDDDDIDDDDDPDRTMPLGRLLDMTLGIEQFARRLEREHSRCAVAVIVDADANRHSSAHRDLLGALHTRLAGAGADLLGAYATTEIAVGARWWSLTNRSVRGRIEDPETSVVAVAQVYAGKQILGSRAAVAQLVCPDPARQAEVSELIDAAAASVDLEYSLGAESGDSRAYHKRKLEQVLRQITNVAAGEPLLAVEVAELGLTLSKDRLVRDALLSLAAGSAGGAAEQLWFLLTRSLPDPHRAEAAALLAFSAFLRGDGTLAAIALSAALTADVQHRLANLLNLALEQGIGRAELVNLARIGYEGALSLGVQLPPVDGTTDPDVRLV